MCKAPFGLSNGYITEGNFNMLLGNGDGTFQHRKLDAVGDYTFALIAHDFNSDTKLDLAVTLIGNDKSVSVLLGNGDGTFQNPRAYIIGSKSYSLEASDFNNDTKLVTNLDENSITILLNSCP